jgi:uncharacterized protein YjdB
MIVGAGNAWADEVTFAYGDYNKKGTSSTGSEYTMEKEDVAITNTKFYGNNSYAHFYANGTTTVTPASGVTITKIVLTASATNYNGFQSSGVITASTGEISGSTSSTTVTWTGSATSAFTITNNKQIRWTSIVVTYSTSGGSSLTDNNLALTGAPISLSFDLYNSSSAQVVNYTTSSTGAVTVSESVYATFAIDAENKTITVTPKAVTPSAQTITVNQAADETYKAGSATFTLTITDSTPIPTHTATFSVNGNTTTQDFEEGANIVFPSNPADVNGKKFMGWVTEAIEGTTNEEPSFVTSATMSTNDVTYYAVFATVTPGTAQDASVTINTLTANLPTSYGGGNKFTEYTLDGVKFKIQQMYKNGSKLQWRADGNSNGAGTMYNTEALQNIQSVVITYDDSDNGKNFTLKVGDSENPTSGTAITPSNEGNVYTYDCSGYNKNFFVLANGEYAGYLTSIVINYQTGTPDTYSAYCTTVAAAVAVTSVTLDQTSKALFVGDEFDLTATITPDNATVKTVTWASSDETKATVVNGHVTALAAGTPTITVTTTDGGKTATCELTISNIAVTGVTLNKDAAIIYTGSVNNTVLLTPTIAPVNATIKTVLWESSDEEVATVDENGLVTAVAEGTATITVTTTDGSFTATCVITVETAPGSAEKPYTIAQAREAIDEGTGTTDVYVKGIVCTGGSSLSGGALNYWISDDGTETGKFEIYKGKGIGGANFTATSDIQVGDVVVVRGNIVLYGESTYEFSAGSQLVSLSRKSVPSLVFDKNAYTVKVGGDLTITASSEDSDGAITYTSSDEEVATIAADGKVTALKVGETTITATIAETEDFKSTTAEVTLTVVDARDFVTEITALAPTTVYVGQEGTFTLTETPAGEATYSYESSDDEVLLVADNEFVGVQAGQANVTVTATPQDEVNYQTATFVANVTVSYKYEAPAIADESFNKTYTVTIPAIDGADIYYTLDGTTPTASSTKYTEAFVLDATTTVKAIAIDTDGLVSPVATATYTKEPLKYEVIALTNTLTFNDFSGLGGYSNDRSDYLVANDGDTYKWTGNQYCYNSQYVALQMRAKGNANGTGTISSTVTSKKGFKLTLEFTDNATPSVYVGEDIQNATSSTSTSAVYEIESTSATLTIEAGSKATYITSITLSPIKNNRTLAFSEPTTEILVNATATNAATATPAGTITYTSSDETVATVDAEGKVTGVKIGTATITATVAEDADYNEATASYEVTVNGIPAATDIVLTATDENEAPVALNEIEVGTIGTFAATYTKAADNVTVTYTSDATDVLTIENNMFGAVKGGTANVTVTITPADADHYVAVSKEFEVTVLNAQRGTTELTIVNGEVEEQTSGNTLYGTNINLTAMLAANYDGTVTASLTNGAIANVAIEGENITITPKAVGTTTITFTASETVNFEGEVSKTYELTVTAPEGQTACEYIPAIEVLNETFNGCDGTGGNDGTFSGSVGGKNIVYDGTSWSMSNASGANKCIKVGTSSGGYATTPTLNLESDKTYAISFRVAGWINDGTTLTLSATKGTLSQTNIEMTSGEWTEHTVTLTGANGETTIKFQPAKRCFLDDVKVEIPEVAPAIPDVTIAESGYASFCCEYPLDFTEANENYKAWYVSEVSGTTVTFKQIKGKIAGGVPFFLYGEKGTYHLQVAAEGTETLSGNMLVGTLAPTYVESEVGDYTNFGLSEGSFKKMNTGVVKANKAYLPILTENVPAGARLNIIFDDETPTGISSVNTDNLNKNNDVYNLNGQRVENMKKGGLYIVNGKKVFMKGQR